MYKNNSIIILDNIHIYPILMSGEIKVIGKTEKYWR